MGDSESDRAEKVLALSPFAVTENLMKMSSKDSLFMHCLPAFHDCQTKFVSDAWQNFGVDVREVSDEVFRSKHSIVFNEAANRLHSIKAILVATLGNPNNNQLGA